MSDIFDHYADAVDDLFFGRTSEEGVTPRAFGKNKEISCKYCGMGNKRLVWVYTGFQWRLFDRELRTLHVCKDYKR